MLYGEDSYSSFADCHEPSAGLLQQGTHGGWQTAAGRVTETGVKLRARTGRCFQLCSGFK